MMEKRRRRARNRPAKLKMGVESKWCEWLHCKGLKTVVSLDIETRRIEVGDMRVVCLSGTEPNRRVHSSASLSLSTLNVYGRRW